MRCENKTFLQNDPGFLQEISSTAVEVGLGGGQTVNGQPLVVGQGLTASTSVLNTGFGFNYFPYFHIGATSWYLTGVQAVNPLQLADR